MTELEERTGRATAISELAARLRANVGQVIEGKPEVVEAALVVLFAEGHLLVQDVPGVGKTQLAKAIARSIGGTVRRIQFTPDLLPSDITGVSVFNQDTRDFEFRPGGVFAHIVIGDEINRASPKTQSALLECLEERQVTVDAQTYPMASPFMVIATQNPVEMDGTYPLPEAQRDRFMARLSVGYPSAEAEVAMLAGHASTNPLDALEPVASIEEVQAAITEAAAVHVAPDVQLYAVTLTAATREHPDLALGASPRATLHLIRAAKARAALDGRTYVVPDDVAALAPAVLTHRLIPNAHAALAGRTAETVIERVLATTPVPAPRA